MFVLSELIINDKNVDVDRKGSNVTIKFNEAECPDNCTILYSVYIKSLIDINSNDWCTNETVIDLAPYSEKMNFKIHHLKFGIIEVYAHNLNETVSLSYNRIVIDPEPSQTALRITANVLAPAIIIIPAIILFTGYHRRFRSKKLVFSYFNFGRKPNFDEPISDEILEKVIEEDEKRLEVSQTSKRATYHTIIFLVIQAVCQLIVVILSAIFNNLLAPHLFVSIITLPILALCFISLRRLSHFYVLGYMIMMLWIISIQIPIMQLYINFYDNFIGQNDETFNEWPIILTQFIITISSMFAVISLSPTSFLYVKRSNDSIHPEKSITNFGRLIVITVYLYIIITLAWNGLSLYYLTYITPNVNFNLRPILSAHVQIAFAFFSLFASMGVLYSSKTYISINAIVQFIALPYVIFQFISDIVVDWHSIIRIIDNDNVSIIIIYTLRAISLVVQILLLVLSILYYRKLLKTSIFNLFKYFYPKSIFKRMRFFKTCLFALVVLEVILAYIMLIFNIKGDKGFPMVYFFFYLLLLSVPPSLIGLWTFSPHFLLYTSALNLVPLVIWFIYFDARWLPAQLILIAKFVLILYVAGLEIRRKKWRRQLIKEKSFDQEEMDVRKQNQDDSEVTKLDFLQE